MSFYSWRPYVSVSERRAKARKAMEKLKKKGAKIQPVEIDGRKIAASFWGKGWCDHLESFSDYENRLPRGRTYVRNGSVCHLEIHAGRVEAMVSGSELYKIVIEIKPLVQKTWKDIKTRCRGHIGSVLELLQGRLSDHVMTVVTDRKDGLFPQEHEIKLKCSCPDWATMCKHVAAVLYGVGSRLDHQPELLFTLRGVDAGELITDGVALPTGAAAATGDGLAEGELADIFGVDIETLETPRPTAAKPAGSARHSRAGGSVLAGLRTDKMRKNATASESPVPKPRKDKKKTAQKKMKLPFDPTAPTGEGIASLRRLSGLSEAEFAAALGVSVQSVIRWESISGPLLLRARPVAALKILQEERVEE